MRRSRAFVPLLLGALVLVSACDQGEEVDLSREPVMDTTNEDPMDGVPTTVLVEEAEAIPPEVAAERGLIPDTALTDEGDPGRDSVPGAAPPPPPGMPPESTGVRVPRP